MAAFDFKQAEEIRGAYARHQVRYLFIGKPGAILLGHTDTTERQAEEIGLGKDFIQLKNGPFDLDLVFAPGMQHQ